LLNSTKCDLVTSLRTSKIKVLVRDNFISKRIVQFKVYSGSIYSSTLSAYYIYKGDN
jgi:hypothetical protein